MGEGGFCGTEPGTPAPTTDGSPYSGYVGVAGEGEPFMVESVEESRESRESLRTRGGVSGGRLRLGDEVELLDETADEDEFDRPEVAKLELRGRCTNEVVAGCECRAAEENLDG